MSDLLELAMTAHGGRAAWQAFTRLEAKLSVTGAIWDIKKQPGLMVDVTVDIATTRQHVIISPFTGPGRRSVFEPGLLKIETFSGQVVAEQKHPRDAAMRAAALDVPWSPYNVAYFNSYALWTYLTSPFLYARPGFLTEEIAPWTEDGETWRRLKVTFPESIVSHARDQVLYFGPDGLMRRHDYDVEVLGGATGANYPSAYRDFHGIKIPTRRHVFARDAAGHKVFEPLLVKIAIDDVHLS